MYATLTRNEPNTADDVLVINGDTLTIVRLSRRCKEEACCSLQRVPSLSCVCLELFCRAVVEREDAAWVAVYAQYAGMVRRWLALPEAEGDEGVAIVFERFWQAVDGPKFARFPSLAAILQYLKVCAYTARIDRGRRAQATAGEWSLDAATHVVAARDNVEEMVAGRLDAVEFWAMVRTLLCDDREGVVLYLSYVLGLSPREICAHDRGHFSNVAEVYRLKRTVLDRLRRAPDMRALVARM